MWNCHKTQIQHKIWDKMMYKITIFGKNEILTFFPKGQNGSIWVCPRKKRLTQKTSQQHIKISSQRPYQLIEIIK